MDRTVAERKRQRRFTRRSRMGCITCKRRRKKCDETHPHCKNCLRVKEPCEWPSSPPEEQDAAPIVSEDAQTMHGQPLAADSWASPHMMSVPISLSNSDSISKEQQYLLSYYIGSLVPTISVVSDPKTYYTALYVPMAFHSRAVLNAILASAASHLSKTLDDQEKSAHFARIASLHQLLCHDLLLTRIYEGNSSLCNSDETLAVVLLLVGLETQNGTNVKWTKQLNCARQIIALRGGAEAFLHGGWETRSLYAHFLYHDVMASIMEETHVDATGSLSGSGQTPVVVTENSTDSADVLNKLDPLMGLSSSLFSLIRETAAIQNMSDGMDRESAFIRLETAINCWSVNRRGACSLEGFSLDVELDLIALAETYRLAALILLYRTSTRYQHLLPKLAKQVLAFVARIPKGNQVEAGLTYPLFLAGGELLEWEDMEFCALRLRGIRERTKINNIRAVEDLLESVWRVRLNGEHCDWVEILQEEGRIICIA